ncbi:MAG TPA: ABC transporter substrate-binding protein [Thermodesulfobacteriota bacterium]|nr:ABC transporter substrate-binding protein [Thermodesulfobacteriota bacterium]
MKRFIVLGFVLSLLAVGTWAFAADTIKIGVVGPRTGPAAATGKAFEEGIAIALDHINAKGGVLGKPLEVVFEDTGGVPEKAASAFEKLATRDKVPVVVGESHSSSALAEIELANRYKVPLIICEAWHDDITKKNYKWVFRAGPANSGVVDFYIAPFVKENGFKKVAIVRENSDWGVGIAERTEMNLKNFGIPFMTLKVERESKDFYTELTKIKAENPDIILAYIYGTGLHFFVSQANEVGLSPKSLILDGAGPPSLWPEFWKNVGKAGELELFMSSMHEKVHLTSTSRKFWDDYKKKYGKDPTDYKVRSIYNVVLIAADAISRAKSVENEAIVAALEKTNLEVTTGIVKFGLKQGSYEYHQWMPPMLVVQWQEQQQVVVYPKEAATGALKKGK